MPGLEMAVMPCTRMLKIDTATIVATTLTAENFAASPPMRRSRVPMTAG